MKIIMIGTGNVATVLARQCMAAGHRMLQVYGRNHVAAAVLAKTCGADTCAAWQDISQQADVYILALSDTALFEGIPLSLQEQTVVHTAGAVPLATLERLSPNHGVLYPLQSIRKETTPLHLPFLVDGSNAETKDIVFRLAKSLSDDVQEADDDMRLHYHLCGVVVNNFSNYLFALTEQYCANHKLRFKTLLPLMEETVHRLHAHSPLRMQTGPAVRGDKQTMERHLALLEDEPALKTVYAHFSQAIENFFAVNRPAK